MDAAFVRHAFDRQACTTCSRSLLAYAGVYVAFAAAFFFAFAVLQQHIGYLELRHTNSRYHLFLQRLAILLLVVLTQMLLCAAVLASAHGGHVDQTGSSGVLLLLIGVMKNGRLCLVMLLFGWTRAANDIDNSLERLREWRVLPPMKTDTEEQTEEEESAVALFPPMY